MDVFFQKKAFAGELEPMFFWEPIHDLFFLRFRSVYPKKVFVGKGNKSSGHVSLIWSHPLDLQNFRQIAIGLSGAGTKAMC